MHDDKFDGGQFSSDEDARSDVSLAHGCGGDALSGNCSKGGVPSKEGMQTRIPVLAMSFLRGEKFNAPGKIPFLDRCGSICYGV